MKFPVTRHLLIPFLFKNTVIEEHGFSYPYKYFAIKFLYVIVPSIVVETVFFCDILRTICRIDLNSDIINFHK